MKNKHSKRLGLLQPIPASDIPWTDVSIDFVFKLPRTAQGHDGILVVCDRFSKMAHFIPCRETITAEETVPLLLRHVITRYGVPQTIISDRDTRFMSKFWRTLFKCLGARVKPSTAYHPQTDGQTERTNQTLE